MPLYLSDWFGAACYFSPQENKAVVQTATLEWTYVTSKHVFSSSSSWVCALASGWVSDTLAVSVPCSSTWQDACHVEKSTRGCFRINGRLVSICMSSDFHLPKCKKPLHCSVVSRICIILVGPVLPSMVNSEAFSCASPSWRPLQILLSSGCLHFSLHLLQNGEAWSCRGLQTGEELTLGEVTGFDAEAPLLLPAFL